VPHVAGGPGNSPPSRLKIAMTRFARVPAAPGGKPLARRLAKRLGGLAALLVALASGCDQAEPPTSPERVQPEGVSAVAPPIFAQVSAGDLYSCGVSTTNVAYCWGYNSFGQLGDGTGGSGLFRTLPTRVVGGLTFRQVSTGHLHTCGVTTANVAYCWGWNPAGELGDGTRTDRLRPVRVAGGLLFRSVTAGGSDIIGGYTCGVTTTNVAYCWGANLFGQLGDGTTTARLRPVRVAGGLAFRRVSAGRNWHTCGVTTGNVAYCWGANQVGQLGNGSRTGPQICPHPSVDDFACSTRPTRVAGGLAFRQVSAGGNHTCGVTTAGRAFCWGAPGGALGDGTTVLKLTPVPVVGGITFRGVSAGEAHSCGVSTTDVAWCWGGNSSGQLGDDTKADRLRPVRVAGGFAFRQVSAGDSHTCSVTLTNVAYCWGDNFYGGLGDGTRILRTRPIRRVG
jgi:alpha-tubulin suppressor-like RCC1 family protein